MDPSRKISFDEFNYGINYKYYEKYSVESKVF